MIAAGTTPKRMPVVAIASTTRAAAAAKAGLPTEDYAARMGIVWDAIQVARRRLRTEASAKWWIDNCETVGSHMRTAYKAAEKKAFADLIEARAAAKAEQERAERERHEQKRQEENARREAEHREAVRAAAEAEESAATFVVDGAPGGAAVKNGDFEAQARDGRMALGYIDGGSWGVYKVGDAAISSMTPQAERIAREARAVWEARRSA